MSSYFTPFMSGVIDKANRMGYHVLVYSVGKAKDFDHVKEVFYDQTVSSGIFIGQQNDDDAIREILANHYKAVLVDKKLSPETRSQPTALLSMRITWTALTRPQNI